MCVSACVCVCAADSDASRTRASARASAAAGPTWTTGSAERGECRGTRRPVGRRTGDRSSRTSSSHHDGRTIRSARPGDAPADRRSPPQQQTGPRDAAPAAGRRWALPSVRGRRRDRRCTVRRPICRRSRTVDGRAGHMRPPVPCRTALATRGASDGQPACRPTRRLVGITDRAGDRPSKRHADRQLARTVCANRRAAASVGR